MNKCIAGMLHRVFNLVLSTAYLIVVTTIIGMGRDNQLGGSCLSYHVVYFYALLP